LSLGKGNRPCEKTDCIALLKKKDKPEGGGGKMEKTIGKSARIIKWVLIALSRLKRGKAMAGKKEEKKSEGTCPIRSSADQCKGWKKEIP